MPRRDGEVFLFGTAIAAPVPANSFVSKKPPEAQVARRLRSGAYN
jgi:hypothetical protein